MNRPSGSRRVLGIDLGTSSVKAAVVDDTGQLIDTASREYPVHRRHPGWAESDPQDWWSAVIGAVADLRLDPAPEAIGLSGQMHGVVLCRADATPVAPALLWCDSRAETELDHYRGLPDHDRARLGNPLSPGMAGPLLSWTQRNEPDRITRARWALQPKDWLRARLTGEFSAEPSDASATLLYDVITDDWHAGVITALGLHSELLAPVLPSSATPAGRLREAAADRLGLPAGLLVAAGAADTAAAALGTGLTDPERTLLTIGTGTQVINCVNPPTEAALQQHPVTHLYRTALPHGWYAMAASLSGGQSLSWVREILGVDWAELYAAADHRPAPDDPIFIPHVGGERTPYLDPDLRASWTGLGAGHDRQSVLYAALEGVAFSARDALEALPARQSDDHALLLAGGGTTATGWRSLLADALGSPLDGVSSPAASVRGAGLLALQAAGQLEPDELTDLARLPAARVAEPGPRTSLLDERFARYRQTMRSLARVRPSDHGAGH